VHAWFCAEVVYPSKDGHPSMQKAGPASSNYVDRDKRVTAKPNRQPDNQVMSVLLLYVLFVLVLLRFLFFIFFSFVYFLFLYFVYFVYFIITAALCVLING